jgi:hypothetical protein
MMFVTVLLPYSIFRFSSILHFCKFPDWFEPWLVDPQPFVSRLGQYPCSAKLGTLHTAKSLPCRHGSLPTQETINGSFWKSLLDRAMLKTMAYYSEQMDSL